MEVGNEEIDPLDIASFFVEDDDPSAVYACSSATLPKSAHGNTGLIVVYTDHRQQSACALADIVAKGVMEGTSRKMHEHVSDVQAYTPAEFIERFRRKVPLCYLHRLGPPTPAENVSLAARWRKIVFDRIGALILLVFSLPILAFSSVAILCESGFPVFYRQVRVGRGGRTFPLYKLRTMCRDAEQDSAQFSAPHDDTRVTRVGRALRRTHIDELPQLINVLKGEMSLIGPRPERLGFTDQFSRHISSYKLRLLVRPGITGWAQVSLPYDEYRSGMEKLATQKRKLAHDLYYIKFCSFVLDLEIVWKTVCKLLRGRG